MFLAGLLAYRFAAFPLIFYEQWLKNAILYSSDLQLREQHRSCTCFPFSEPLAGKAKMVHQKHRKDNGSTAVKKLISI